MKTIDKDILMMINELSSFSKMINFLKISFECLQNQDECRAILSDEFNLHDEPTCITFKRESSYLSKNRPKETIPINIDLCEEASRSVLENPLLMESILEQLECFDIQRFRKVNRGIRRCIDIVQPNPRVKSYNIVYRSSYEKGLPLVSIGLESGDHKSNIYWTRPKEFWLTDFEVIFKHQKSCIEELSIVYGCLEKIHSNFVEFPYIEISKQIGDILKRREHPLKTRKFSMGSRKQLEILEILLAVDRNSLEIIELLHPVCDLYFRYEEMPIEVDQLSQTRQWQNAEQLISKHLTITTPIQDMNILHFVNLEILVKTLSSQDVNYLRTNLLESRTFQKFKICFRESTIDESLHRLIGEPYRIISDVKKVWYFRMENTDYYIHIVLDTSDVKDKHGKLKPKVFIFTRVAKEDTPFFELPIDQLRIN
ncbi:unnamed protein product [Caenorhabditis nigoni]